MSVNSSVGRIRFLSLCIVALAGLFTVRLLFLQVIKSDEYSDMADRQYLRPSTHVFDRGSIFFKERDGKLVSAATLKSGFLLAIKPDEVKNAEDTYAKLNAITPLERETFMRRAAKQDDPYEEITNHLDEKAAEAIKKLSLPGVYLYKERWRYYPAGSLASHVLGFLGYHGDILGGRYGLEKHYDDVLSRSEGMTFVNFFAEVFSGIGTKLFNDKKHAAQGDIVLTIDPIVQTYLEKELKAVHDRWDAELTGGIIMDPKTGEIVAMGSMPNFDPGGRQSDVSLLANPMVDRVYEMGSIVKPLTMAAALDTGAVTAKTTFYDAGSITLNTKRISNHDGKVRGTVDMQQVLNDSLNTGVTFAMQRMGRDRFSSYFKNFGLGEKTGIDLPNEVSGLIDNLDSPRDVEHATASFGQGIAFSPIVMTRALAVLANGGVLVKPHVVKQINYETMLSEEVEPEVGRRVIKPETSHEVSRMLVKVVDDALAGGKASMPHYSVAAKTGTAQIAGPGGKYYSDRYLHSFFGYFPAYDARFITFLFVVHPKGARYASETLTDPFMNTTKFLLNYYEVPPDR
ncbi:MAG TPA: penicillin-binding protein 2 [Candidatus Paceibacterota bacterium]|nr:penicillin-binding protein 2 [Candidatus Paceibacterota bacterium]